MRIKGVICKCKSEEFFGEQHGNHYGVYCEECGAWVKWASKNEKRLLERGKRNDTK